VDSDENKQKQRLCEAVAEGMYALDNTAQSMGVRIDSVRPGSARASMKVREDMLNSHGTCHGGMLFTFADTVFAYACNSENKATVALSCTIDYAKAAKLGDELIAVGEENFRNSRTGVYDIVITRKDGTTLCIFKGGSYQVNAESVPGLNKTMGITDS
jgi:acyl-CoA thioesterase